MRRGAAKGSLPFDLSISDPKERIQAYLDIYNDPDYAGFEATIMRSMRVISAKKTPIDEGMVASATFELTVPPELCNPMDRMHGGAMATLADMATTMATAPVSTASFWHFGGVSRTLSVTYLNPAFVGETVVIESSAQRPMTRIAVTQGVVKHKQSGKLLALAEHGKSALSEQGKSKL